MIEHSASIAALSKAIHAAQGVLTGVVKDSKNPHFKNRYASLEAVLDTARPALQANGLSVTQAPGALVEGSIEITTMLMHTSGEWMRSTLHMPVVKRDPQGVGSAITYGLRYALMAALGVPPTDDDDGERAMPDRPQQQRQTGPALHTNGMEIELSSSQRMAQDMMASLWKISGDRAVSRWLGLEPVKRDPECLDQADRQKVEAFAEERRAIQ
ncbi:ERF family protein [Methylobacterium nigriterrae]|uniref:ERF family protein n=1 Tax=Methylobacterium nigriterrae TaxID=3127512 RepID=UPI0030141665